MRRESAERKGRSDLAEGARGTDRGVGIPSGHAPWHAHVPARPRQIRAGASPSAPAKIYVEVTNACNLACRTCIRNVWQEDTGFMAMEIFERILQGLRGCAQPCTLSFGGFGEPLFHPRIHEMVASAKQQGANVELVTNGTLLNEEKTGDLIAAGLDRLWISLDGATPESYADVRLGAALPEVLANVRRFVGMRVPRQSPLPELGIIFVAMKRNIADLPKVMALAEELDAARLLVTNVIPHTAELRDEILYAKSLGNNGYYGAASQPKLILPRIDAHALREHAPSGRDWAKWEVQLSGDDRPRLHNRCPFIEEGAQAVRWDGGVSPCLPLLHESVEYLNRRPRIAHSWIVGNLGENGLIDLWHRPEYGAFRERVWRFDFAPCTLCDGCSLSESNMEDCYGNTFPTCGGCLWAQGFIQCP